MAVLHIVLWNFALVHFLLFSKEIDGEALLQQCRAFILLVFKDALHRAGLPPLLTRRRRYAIRRQFLCNGDWGKAFHKTCVDSTDDDRFFRHNLWKTVLSLSVSEKLLIRQANLSVCEAFSLTPGNVLRNGAAFFLGKARHDGQQQLALSVKGVNILFLKEYLNTFFLQLSDGY